MEKSARIGFRYYKSNNFRVIHADGIFGGLTPRLSIFLSFYSERFPIPEVTVHTVGPDGKLAEELLSERQTKPEIIREVEAGVVMDLEVARSLIGWLTEKVGEVEKVMATQKAQRLEKI